MTLIKVTTAVAMTFVNMNVTGLVLPETNTLEKNLLAQSLHDLAGVVIRHLEESGLHGLRTGTERWL